jgi:rod shape-determining protein MreB
MSTPRRPRGPSQPGATALPLQQRLSPEAALDLGSERTRLILPGLGVVVHEPSVVCFRDPPRGVSRFGADALTAPPDEEGVRTRPIVDGAVTSWPALEQLVQAAMARVDFGGWRRPRLLVAAPADANETELRALQGSLMQAGARVVDTVPSPIAAALGARLPVVEPTGSLLITLGAGTFDVAVICFGRFVTRTTLRSGAAALARRGAAWLRRNADLLVDEATALAMIAAVGTAARPVTGGAASLVRVEGRSLRDGRVAFADVDAAALIEAWEEPTRALIDAALETVRRCPAEISADLARTGALLAGGFAELPGLAARLGEALELPVVPAEDPALAVARGLERLLLEPGLLAAVSGAS